MSCEKYHSFLYNPPKPFHKMTLRELCDYNKIIQTLDKMSLNKIRRIEKWPEEKRRKKIKKFLNKKMNIKTLKCRKNLKKSSKRKTRRLKLNKQYFLKLN